MIFMVSNKSVHKQLQKSDQGGLTWLHFLLLKGWNLQATPNPTQSYIFRRFL